MTLYALVYGDWEGNSLEGVYSSPEAAERARQGRRYPLDYYIETVQLNCGIREWQAFLHCFAPKPPPTPRKSSTDYAAFNRILRRIYSNYPDRPDLKGKMVVADS